MISSFPGYEYINGKNIFHGEDIGRGGLVWAIPGIYYRVYTFDVRSMHPSSIIAMQYFGEYTKRYEDMINARAAIKHKDYESAKKLMNGALSPFLTNEEDAKAISNALKIALNSCYGLTSASFANIMRHRDNVNNIVALRGALFMATLKDEVIKRGGKPFHIKTDSIKIENPSENLKEFIFDFAKQYGYEFEIEHIFEKVCLVNNAVYIAKLADDDPENPGKWTATGAQFQHPYIFKSIFSHEPIVFDDLCETKEVKNPSNIYLDMNEDLEDVTLLENELDKLNKKYRDENGCYPFDIDQRVQELKQQIEKGHNYTFVGRVGLFCPVKSGANGGLLVRSNGDKYDSVTGTKGYRWLEAEVIKQLGKEKDIDMSYFRKLVDDALAQIAEFGDVEAFIADDSPEFEHPFDVLPWCDKEDCNSCADRVDCHNMASNFVTNI